MLVTAKWGLALEEPDLEGVAQGVTDVVDRNDNEDEDEGQRVDLPPEAILDLGGAGLEHRAPVRLRGLNTESEEPEGREGEDRLGDRERRHGHDVADRVREDVAADDVPLARSHGRGGLRVLQVPDKECVASNDARVTPPQREADDADQEQRRSVEDG